MAGFIAVLILVAVAFWLGREFASVRRRQAFLASRDGRGRPVPVPHRRVPEPAIAEHAAVLRDAVGRGDVTPDEATGSLIRFAGGGMSHAQASRLLEG